VRVFFVILSIITEFFTYLCIFLYFDCRLHARDFLLTGVTTSTSRSSARTSLRSPLTVLSFKRCTPWTTIAKTVS
jgi:hypothetical protein